MRPECEEPLCTETDPVVPNFEPAETGRDSFGACPACGGSDGYLDVGPDHWMVCHAHQKAWWIGSNLFSAWREGTQEQWERNRALLATYQEIRFEEALPALACPACGAPREGEHASWCDIRPDGPDDDPPMCYNDWDET